MTSRRRLRHAACLGLAMSAVLLAGGCGEPAGDSGSADAASTGATATGTGSVAPQSPPTTSASPRRFANPADYESQGARYPQWGFVTPSSAWICVIGTYPSGGDNAACAANPSQGPLLIPDVPFAQADGGGNGTQKPNTIFVGEGVDATFGLVRQSIWAGDGGPRTLPYDTVLQAGGFSCNTQESAVSCRYDATGQGFSVSTKDYRFVYTDVPAG